jgi:hypothetical protein
MNNAQAAAIILMSGFLGAEFAEAASLPETGCVVEPEKSGATVGLHLDYHADPVITADPVIELEAHAYSRCTATAELTTGGPAKEHAGLDKHLDYQADAVAIRPIDGFISTTLDDVR